MTELRFRVPCPPSLKNGVVLGRGKVRTSQRVLRSMREIREAIRREIGDDFGHTRSLFGGDEVAVEVTHQVQAGTIEVVVRRLGPTPPAPNGRERDLQNLQDTLCDAMEKLVFDDDCQVGELVMKRSNS